MSELLKSVDNSTYIVVCHGQVETERLRLFLSLYETDHICAEGKPTEVNFQVFIAGKTHKIGERCYTAPEGQFMTVINFSQGMPFDFCPRYVALFEEMKRFSTK